MVKAAIFDVDGTLVYTNDQHVAAWVEIDGVTTSDEVVHSKPAPDIFQAALKRLASLTAEAVIVVGNTPHGALAAGKAGLCTIGSLRGGLAEAVPQGAGCMALYRDPADSLAQYSRSPLAQS